jgi:HSP20 family protein
MTLVKLKNGLENYPAMRRNYSIPSIFHEAFDKFWSEDNSNWVPSANIKERANDFLIELAVPGMDKKDFKIEVDNNILSVSAEMKEEKNEETEKYTRKEFHSTSFKRSFTLPDSVKHEQIQANYNNGILNLIVPKKDEVKQKVKEITVE